MLNTLTQQKIKNDLQDIPSPKLKELPTSISMYCAEFYTNPKVKQTHTIPKGQFMIVNINYAKNSIAYGQL